MTAEASSATSMGTSFSTESCLRSTTNHQVSAKLFVFFFASDLSVCLYGIAVESNGVQISEFTPDKWYFLGLEHNKPYLARAHLTAIVNDKQVVNFPMDYPRFD